MAAAKPKKQPKKTAKIDLYKQHEDEYATPKTPVLVTIKPAVYLAISGQGAPGGERFTAAVGALYNVAFTIKMARKFGGRQDYAVSKLEGLWFLDPAEPPEARDEWRWKLLIRTPSFVSTRERDAAVQALLAKGKPPEVRGVSLEKIDEGRCVQMLHVGSYDREAESIALMRGHAKAHGFALDGPHHEIYLSDPRRVPAARLRTILREPLRPA
ncbi:MAG TPA: GyrI-like domain-containing protein [Vicinamibacterales bacterium]|jgi:hypothetical protein